MTKDQGYIDALLGLAAEDASMFEATPRGDAPETDEPFIDDSVDGSTDLDTIFKSHDVGPATTSRGGDELRKRAEEIIGTRGSLRDDFAAHVERLGLRYFQPHELLVMGGSNAGGPCKGSN